MKKKVLFVIDTLNGGGAEKILLDIIPRLDYRKYRIELLTVWNRGYYLDHLPSNIKPSTICRKCKNRTINKVYGVLFEKCINMFSGTVLHKLMIHRNYDVEIAFLEGAATKIVSGSKAKKIAWVHTDMINNAWCEQFYKNIGDVRRTYVRFDRICFVSGSLKTAFEKKYRVNRNNTIVYNPVDVDSIMRKSCAESDIFLQKDVFSFVTVGRLETEKGYDRLINIALALRNAGFCFNIYIIGKGSLEDILKRSINDLGVGDCVHILGYQPNPYPIIRQADVFVCSSLIEGFSTAVTEALVLGIPVLTTDCAGMDELLNGGKNGMICKNDESSLLEAMKKLLSEPDTVAHLRAMASERGRDFNLVNALDQIERIINE